MYGYGASFHAILQTSASHRMRWTWTVSVISFSSLLMQPLPAEPDADVQAPLADDDPAARPVFCRRSVAVLASADELPQ